jgi:hypothetical protein
MVRHKYTVSQSTSIAGVLRLLNIPAAGGSHTHIKNRIQAAGLSTDHFLGQGHTKGKRSFNRKLVEDILVLEPEGSSRSKPTYLRRALDESGIPYLCAFCENNGTWNDASLVLEVDHIDGNWLNNVLSNLRYLCPNCHSQLPTNKSWKNSDKDADNMLN